MRERIAIGFAQNDIAKPQIARYGLVMENKTHILTKWLDRNQRTIAWLARNLDIHAGTLSRQLKKDTPMITRLAIQSITQGEVMASDWPGAK